MLSIAFWIIVGIIIGWKVKQPDWTKSSVDKAVELAKSIWAWAKAKVAKKN
jgi:hypothetical protein